MANDLVPSPAWWRHGYVWLVVAGPFIVVVASFITLYLAIITADDLVDENYYQKGLQLNRSSDKASGSLVPAIQGRNHAVTGVPLQPTKP